MNILIISSKLSYGGAEHVAAMLANGFVAKGHHVFLLTNLFDPVSYKLDPSIQLNSLFGTVNNRMSKWLSCIKIIRNTIRQNKIDVVICIANTTALFSKVASIGLNVPIIITEHDSFERPTNAPFGFYKKLAKFQLNKLFRYVTVLTQRDKVVIGARLKNVTVMPNPLACFSLETNVQKRKNQILAVGRLEDSFTKGFDVLISAWGQLASEFPEWQLGIAGYGTEKEVKGLMDKVREAGCESQFQYLGYRQDLNTIFAETSIFVLSSRYEGFGLVLIEAMSQGCACVACDYLGRQSEIITSREEGLCCVPDSVEALRDALKLMLTDSGYRESVRRKAIERAQYYSIENTIVRWEVYLNSIIGNM